MYYVRVQVVLLTHVGKIVDQNDFADEVFRRPVQNGMHRPQQDRPRLVVEANDDRRLRQVVQVLARLFAPGKRTLLCNVRYDGMTHAYRRTYPTRIPCFRGETKSITRVFKNDTRDDVVRNPVARVHVPTT